VVVVNLVTVTVLLVQDLSRLNVQVVKLIISYNQVLLLVTLLAQLDTIKTPPITAVHLVLLHVAHVLDPVIPETVLVVLIPIIFKLVSVSNHVILINMLLLVTVLDVSPVMILVQPVADLIIIIVLLVMILTT